MPGVPLTRMLRSIARDPIVAQGVERLPAVFVGLAAGIGDRCHLLDLSAVIRHGLMVGGDRPIGGRKHEIGHGQPVDVEVLHVEIDPAGKRSGGGDHEADERHDEPAMAAWATGGLRDDVRR